MLKKIFALPSSVFENSYKSTRYFIAATVYHFFRMICLIKFPIDLQESMIILIFRWIERIDKRPRPLRNLRSHFKRPLIRQTRLAFPRNKLQQPIIIPRRPILLIIILHSITAIIPHIRTSSHKTIDIESDDIPIA